MLIEVEKLNYTYASSEKEKVHALKDVSLNIRQGEFVALVQFRFREKYICQTFKWIDKGRFRRHSFPGRVYLSKKVSDQ